MYCKKCGSQIDDTIAFCNKCGASTKTDTIQVNTNTSAFSQTGQVSQTVKSFTASFKKEKSSVPIIVAVLFVVIIAILCTPVILKKNEEAQMMAITTPVNGFASCMAALDVNGAAEYFVPKDKKIIQDTVNLVETLPYGDTVMAALPLLGNFVNIDYNVDIDTHSIIISDKEHAVVPANISIYITDYFSDTERCYFYLEKVNDDWYIKFIDGETV